MSSLGSKFKDTHYSDPPPPSYASVVKARENNNLHDYSVALINFLNSERVDDDGLCSMFFDFGSIIRDCHEYFPDEEKPFDDVITHLLGNYNSEDLRDKDS